MIFNRSRRDQDPNRKSSTSTPTSIGGETGLTQLQRLQKSVLKEPDVLIFPELPEPEVLQVAVNQVEKNEKQIYCRMVADSAMQG